jgi:HAD superfamily hydrolase (TIGR01509 family)
MSKLRALFIDMDGTLVETESRWWAAESEVMQRYGSTWEEDDQNQAIGGPIFKVIEYMGAKAKVDPKILYEDLMNEMIQKFENTKSELQPGWFEIINEELEKKIKVCLVTASNRILADAILKNNDLEKFFDLVITCDDVKETKPHPEPYLTAAQYFHLDVLDCLAFEDSNTGITSSLGAGMPTIAIPERVLLNSRRGMRIVDGLKGMTIQDLEKIHKELKKEWQSI